MGKKSPKIDAYIAKAAPFAKPILNYVRQTVHAACGDAEETLKWGMPFFLYHGKIMCSVAAFKQHCNFHFWNGRMKDLAAENATGDAEPASFRQITKVSDLPKKGALSSLVLMSMQLIEEGVKRPARPKRKKAPIKPPDDFCAALRKNKKALAAFNKFSPSHQREYVEWIVEAKRDETRQKRMQTAIGWLAEGKSRHWKYQRK